MQVLKALRSAACRFSNATLDWPAMNPWHLAAVRDLFNDDRVYPDRPDSALMARGRKIPGEGRSGVGNFTAGASRAHLGSIRRCCLTARDVSPPKATIRLSIDDIGSVAGTQSS
jgi:hypothetical protein